MPDVAKQVANADQELQRRDCEHEREGLMSSVPVTAKQRSRATPVSLAWQITTLLTFMMAVLASHFADSYMAGLHQGGAFADWSWRYLLFAAIVTFASFPVAYQKVTESRNAPVLVQIGTVFLTGLGWDKVLSTLHYISS